MVPLVTPEQNSHRGPGKSVHHHSRDIAGSLVLTKALPGREKGLSRMGRAVVGIGHRLCTGGPASTEGSIPAPDWKRAAVRSPLGLEQLQARRFPGGASWSRATSGVLSNQVPGPSGRGRLIAPALEAIAADDAQAAATAAGVAV